MPVARIQIADLYQAIREPIYDVTSDVVVTRHTVGKILQKATMTMAYKWNKSFRETIDRLRAQHNREINNQ